MAAAKKARLIEAQAISSTTRHLTFEPEVALGFTGGQYIIINSGVTLPDGKLAKRAYSILSSDIDQTRFDLAVLKIEPENPNFSGAGSDYMHHLAVGDQIEFSGPWGKFISQHGFDGPAPTTLVIATDTGITAALGLVNAMQFSPFLRTTKLIWFVESDQYFLANDFSRDRNPGGATHGAGHSRFPFTGRIPVPVGIGAFELRILPAIGLPSRKEKARNIFADLMDQARPVSLFMAGDGDVIFCLREQALARGLSEDAISYECFFNNPQRKAPL